MASIKGFAKEISIKQSSAYQEFIVELPSKLSCNVCVKPVKNERINSRVVKILNIRFINFMNRNQFSTGLTPGLWRLFSKIHNVLILSLIFLW
jgi:hypothetical protein